MGCGGSKESPEEKKKIKFDFDHVGAKECDDFFDNAKGVLENAENLRAGLDDDREELLDRTHAIRLEDKTKRAQTAIQVCFFAMAAEHGGVKNAPANMGSEPPFIKFPESGNNDNVQAFKVANSYLGTLVSGPNAIVEIVKNLTEMTTKAGDLKNSDLGSGTDKLKAVGKLGKNTKKLADGLKKAKALQDLLKEAAKDGEAIVKEIKPFYEAADTEGLKYQGAGKTVVCDIFDAHFTSGVLTEEQVKAEKEEKEKAAKKKK